MFKLRAGDALKLSLERTFDSLGAARAEGHLADI
jgi:hypothetical protein